MVYDVLSMLSSGMTEEEIQDGCPKLRSEDHGTTLSKR
ncbi:MAG: hypothetical protein V4772_06460 [Pseudomonadota bacterium]